MAASWRFTQRPRLCFIVCVSAVFLLLLFSQALRPTRQEQRHKRDFLESTELPAEHIDPAAIDLTPLVNTLINSSQSGSRQLFSLLSVTSYSSLALHKLTLLVYNISSIRNIESNKFRRRFCYCVTNETNDLTDFTAILLDVMGNSTSYLHELFKSASILSVSQRNNSDCIYICVMAGKKDREVPELWQVDSITPLFNQTIVEGPHRANVSSFRLPVEWHQLPTNLTHMSPSGMSSMLTSRVHSTAHASPATPEKTAATTQKVPAARPLATARQPATFAPQTTAESSETTQAATTERFTTQRATTSTVAISQTQEVETTTITTSKQPATTVSIMTAAALTTVPAPSTTATQRPTTTTAQPITATRRSTTATPRPTTATPRPTTATPRPTTATPRPTTATPPPITATPRPTTATPPATTAALPSSTVPLRPTTATPPPITATLPPTTATPRLTTATAQATTTTSRPITATPRPTTAIPLPTTTTSRPITATALQTTATLRPITATPRPTTTTSRPITRTPRTTTATTRPTTATLGPTTIPPPLTTVPPRATTFSPAISLFRVTTSTSAATHHTTSTVQPTRLSPTAAPTAAIRTTGPPGRRTTTPSRLVEAERPGCPWRRPEPSGESESESESESDGIITVSASKLQPCVLELCKFFSTCLCRPFSHKTRMKRYCDDSHLWYEKHTLEVCRRVRRVSFSRNLKQRCLTKMCNKL